MATFRASRTEEDIHRELCDIMRGLKDPRNIIRALCGENVGTIVKE